MRAVTVDGVEIPAHAIAAEMQYHPAPSREAAWREAATALVIRELLRQRAESLGLAERESEEARTEALLAREIAAPEPDEAACRRYWSANPARFRSPDLYEAAHILFPAPAEDTAARERAKAAASETLARLREDPARFAALARERSSCPSGADGGRLGQQSRGDLAPELETFVFALEPGQLCPVPIATRYGYHLLRLDQRVAGKILPFEHVRTAIAEHLRARSWQRAVGRYLHGLAERARVEGLTLEPAASSPVP